MHRRSILLAGILAAILIPAAAQACDGPAGNAVAVSCGGNSCTVTNISRAILSVAFSAWGQNYTVELGPGQSGIPASPGWLSTPMKQYQTCIATVVPAR